MRIGDRSGGTEAWRELGGAENRGRWRLGRGGIGGRDRIGSSGSTIVHGNKQHLIAIATARGGSGGMRRGKERRERWKRRESVNQRMSSTTGGRIHSRNDGSTDGNMRIKEPSGKSSLNNGGGRRGKNILQLPTRDGRSGKDTGNSRQYHGRGTQEPRRRK